MKAENLSYAIDGLVRGGGGSIGIIVSETGSYIAMQNGINPEVGRWIGFGLGSIIGTIALGATVATGEFVVSRSARAVKRLVAATSSAPRTYSLV